MLSLQTLLCFWICKLCYEYDGWRKNRVSINGSEIATEITRRKVEQDMIEKEEELELAMRIEDEARRYYPHAFFPPPLNWIGLARARMGRPCAMTEELHRIGGI